MLDFLAAVFPSLDGLDAGPFLWKAMVFGVCCYLNTVNPGKWVWSIVFLVGLTPVIFFGYSAGDVKVQSPVATLVRFYLSWMCAEVAFRSAAAEPEERIHGWWALPAILIFLL